MKADVAGANLLQREGQTRPFLRGQCVPASRGILGLAHCSCGSPGGGGDWLGITPPTLKDIGSGHFSPFARLWLSLDLYGVLLGILKDSYLPSRLPGEGSGFGMNRRGSSPSLSQCLPGCPREATLLPAPDFGFLLCRMGIITGHGSQGRSEDYVS